MEINAGGIFLHFGDGVNLRYYAAGETIPEKHQLFVAFEDGSALVGTVSMYGGLWCFAEGRLTTMLITKPRRKLVHLYQTGVIMTYSLPCSIKKA